MDEPAPTAGTTPASAGSAPQPEPAGAESTALLAEMGSSTGTSAAYDAGGSTLAAIGTGSFAPPGGSSYASATTPAPAPAGDAGMVAAPLSSDARQQAIAAVLGTGPKEAGWARDAYLAFTAALVAVLVVGGRYFVGARTRPPR